MFKLFCKDPKEPKDPFGDMVKCEVCRHWIDKEDAQIVFFNTFGVYYCQMHKVPYDSVVSWRGESEYFKTIPEHKIQVDINGKEIKKKK